MHGYDEDKAKVIARLRRIEGQVRAITQMVEDNLAEASAAIARLVKS